MLLVPSAARARIGHLSGGFADLASDFELRVVDGAPYSQIAGASRRQTAEVVKMMPQIASTVDMASRWAEHQCCDRLSRPVGRVVGGESLSARRGISILDLLALPPGLDVVLPEKITRGLESLAVLDYSSTTSDGVYVHYGTVQALSDGLLPQLDHGWTVRAPGLNKGLPFQLTVRRNPPVGAENVEPAPSAYLLDLFLDQVEVELPFVRPARLVSGPAIAAHLEDIPADQGPRIVKLVGGGTLRIQASGSGATVRFVDWSDPFDPEAPTGPVFHLSVDPPHFFFGKDSRVGMTLDTLTYDDSESFTPPEIVARGHGGEWRGISLREATLLFPPRTALLPDDFSIGVHDVILGTPTGVQGELHVEFGADPVHENAPVVFVQRVQFVDRDMTVDNGVRVKEVNFADAAGGTAEVRGRLASTLSNDFHGEWWLPDSTEPEFGSATRYFPAKQEDVLAFRLIKHTDEGEVALPWITYIFREASGPPQVAPKVQFRHKGGTIFENVVNVSGTGSDLEGGSFLALPPPDVTVTWRLGDRGAPEGVEGNFINLPAFTEAGTQTLVLKDSKGHERRVLIEVLNEGTLVIGNENGPSFLSGPAEAGAVTGSFDLMKFHQGSGRISSGERATLDETGLHIPEGVLAEVTLKPTLPPPVPQRHIQVQFPFDMYGKPNMSSWGLETPCASSTTTGSGVSIAQIAAWAKGFTDETQFFIVGRCDDIGETVSNVSLGHNRADTLKRVLNEDGAIEASRIVFRGEQEPAGPTEVAQIPLSLLFESEGAPNNPPPVPVSSADDSWRTSWFEKILYGPVYENWSKTDRDLSARTFYRRADVFAIGGQLKPDATPCPDLQAAESPDLRHILVPGADGTKPAKPKPREPELQANYVVRVKVGWDSPSYVNANDFIPTLAEVQLSVEKKPVPLPGTTEQVEFKGTGTSDPPVITYIGRFTQDPRAGDTILSVSVNAQGNPDAGILRADNTTLAIAATFAPALLGGLDPADLDGTDAVRLAGLIIASKLIAQRATAGKVIVQKIEAEVRLRSTSLDRVRLLLDYSADVTMRVSVAGQDVKIGEGETPEEKVEPLRVRYKNVGLMLDNTKSGLEKISLVYEDASFQIEKTPTVTLPGALGRLLRVTGVRAGSGSAWLEVDLGLALDLGPVSLTQTTLRITFSGGNVDVELRGLEVAVDIPKTLQGKGKLALMPDGSFKAALELLVIPADVRAKGSLAFDSGTNFFMLQVDTQFSTGIPLASTGLGIYGFSGRFVSNGKRNLPAGDDPVAKELGWYALEPVDKYVPSPGGWALGFGAVIGSLPDRAFVFNGNGALALDFPGPSVMLGMDGKFVQKRPPLAKEKGNSGNFVGLVRFDPAAVILGIRGEYLIPKLLKIEVPVSGYYPRTAAGGDAYLRIGADNVEGRGGRPVSLTLLPGTADLEAEAFLMIEQRKLHKLGGHPDINFDGFSIGFGARMSFDWSSPGGIVSFHASAEVMAGVGTDPLLVIAQLAADGELDLGPASVGVNGFIRFEYDGDNARLRGEICGKVDLWLFTLKKCLHVKAGGDSVDIPIPISPISIVDLTDRFARVVSQAGGDQPSVWPDTSPVLHFSRYIITSLPNDSQFKIPFDVPGPVWSGSTDLKYAFRLVSLILEKSDGTPVEGPLDASWQFLAHRRSVVGIDSTPPSAQETRDLALLTWDPGSWARNLGIHGGDNEGDPAGTIGEVCDPTPTPVASCAFGQDAERWNIDRVVFRSGNAANVFASYFQANAREGFANLTLEQAAQVLGPYGLEYVPGSVQPLARAFTHGGVQLLSGYELSSVMFQGRYYCSAQEDVALAPSLSTPELYLEVCNRGDESGRICDTFNDLPLDSRHQSLRHNNLFYEAINQNDPFVVTDAWPPNHPDGGRELVVPRGGIRVFPPQPCDVMRVDAAVISTLELWTSITLTAFNRFGNPIATVTPPMERNQLAILEIRARGAYYVEITGGDRFGLVTAVCYTVEPDPVLAGELFPSTLSSDIPQEPVVIGRLDDGTEHLWNTAPIPTAAPGSPCRIVRYVPSVDGLWQSFRIAPFRGRHVKLVAICGVTADVLFAVFHDQKARNDIKDWFTFVAANKIPRKRHLLEAGTEYRIRVRLDWAGWRAEDPDDDDPVTPPPPPPFVADDAWQPMPEQVFTFRTAAETPIPNPPPPVDVTTESVFDPRALVRHVLRFTPTENSPPHLLDDPLQVDLQIDHLETMLSKYGRVLGLKVRRTNPPPASVPPNTPIPDTSVVRHDTALQLALLDASDLRFVQAVSVSTCMPPIDPEGTSIQLDADLAPGGEYDLLFVAPPTAQPESDNVLIARVHFRASRYRNAEELFAGLGFEASPNPTSAGDVVVIAAAPSDVQPSADRAMDDALLAFGLDPWPLPKQPRTSMLWLNDAGDWKLAGVLLEGDEPIVRGNRIGIDSAGLGTLTLSPVRQNAAGTRVLLAPPAPAALTQTGVVTINAKSNGSPLAVGRYLTRTRPLAAVGAT
jgi:hypothetical protein